MPQSPRQPLSSALGAGACRSSQNPLRPVARDHSCRRSCGSAAAITGIGRDPATTEHAAQHARISCAIAGRYRARRLSPAASAASQAALSPVSTASGARRRGARARSTGTIVRGSSSGHELEAVFGVGAGSARRARWSGSASARIRSRTSDRTPRTVAARWSVCERDARSMRRRRLRRDPSRAPGRRSRIDHEPAAHASRLPSAVSRRSTRASRRAAAARFESAEHRRSWPSTRARRARPFDAHGDVEQRGAPAVGSPSVTPSRRGSASRREARGRRPGRSRSHGLAIDRRLPRARARRGRARARWPIVARTGMRGRPHCGPSSATRRAPSSRSSLVADRAAGRCPSSYMMPTAEAARRRRRRRHARWYSLTARACPTRHRDHHAAARATAQPPGRRGTQ